MSLIHYWPLDEASGSTFSDAVGGGTGEVVNDGGSVVTGLFGNARDLGTGTDSGKSHLDLWTGTTESTSFAEWSLSCWVKRGDTNVSFFPELWNFSDYAGGVDTIYGYMHSDASAVYVELIRNSGTYEWDELTANVPVNDNQWHLIIVRSGPAGTELLVDGVVEDSGTIQLSLYPRGADAWFGGVGTTSWADFAADELAAFDHVLTDEEVAQLWNDGAGATADSLGGAPFIPPEGSPQIYYAAELRPTSGDPVRLPISSWQATLQTGRQSYLQCVVPAAEQHIDAITTAGLGSDLAVIRGALLPDGEMTELDMAVVPLEQMPYQRGAQRSTVTLSGFGTIDFTVVDPDAPPAGSTRTLEGVQTLSVDPSGTRARAQIDWLLRPGLIADADGTTFQVSYINYYANATQEFMDVGSRPL